MTIAVFVRTETETKTCSDEFLRNASDVFTLMNIVSRTEMSYSLIHTACSKCAPTHESLQEWCNDDMIADALGRCAANRNRVARNIFKNPRYLFSIRIPFTKRRDNTAMISQNVSGAPSFAERFSVNHKPVKEERIKKKNKKKP